jgi:hypothetical protein
MHETLAATRRPYLSLVNGPNVAWAAAGAVAFVTTAVTMLAAGDLASMAFGEVAGTWIGEVSYGLVAMGVPAAVASIVMLVYASVARFALGRWLDPAAATFVGIAGTYLLIAAITALAGFPSWFAAAALIAGLVVGLGIRRGATPIE